MKCPYCQKTAPAKLDAKGVYWTHCVPCGMRGKGDAGTTTEDSTVKAKKSRKKKSKPAQVDNVEDALFSEVKPD